MEYFVIHSGRVAHGLPVDPAVDHFSGQRVTESQLGYHSQVDCFAVSPAAGIFPLLRATFACSRSFHGWTCLHINLTYTSLNAFTLVNLEQTSYSNCVLSRETIKLFHKCLVVTTKLGVSTPSPPSSCLYHPTLSIPYSP